MLKLTALLLRGVATRKRRRGVEKQNFLHLLTKPADCFSRPSSSFAMTDGVTDCRNC